MTSDKLIARLGEIEKRAKAATDGPWAVESCGEKGDGSNMIGVVFGPDDPDCKKQLSGWIYDADDDGNEIEYYRDEVVAECEHRNRNSHADAAFIAHSITDVRWLIKQLRSALKARGKPK